MLESVLCYNTLMRKRHEIINALKITAAAIAACLVAKFFDLEFEVSAGIVAILSVLPTKKETIKTAAERFMAFAVALLIAGECFFFMGIGLPAFFVYLLLFILFCRVFGFYSAMAPDSVLISHFLTTGMGVAAVGNEISLFVIGASMGILVNLTLHRDRKKMEYLTEKTDDQVRYILARAAQRVVDNDLEGYDGKCLRVLSDLLARARHQADIDYKNDLVDPSDEDIRYIEMRQKQCEILFEIYRNVKTLEATPESAQVISDFLKKIAKEYDRDNDVTPLLAEYEAILDDMEGRPLPATRDEFEDRARLFVLLRSIGDFLMIKKNASL